MLQDDEGTMKRIVVVGVGDDVREGWWKNLIANCSYLQLSNLAYNNTTQHNTTYHSTPQHEAIHHTIHFNISKGMFLIYVLS